MTEIKTNCIKKSDKGVLVTVKLTPNASKDEIIGYCEQYVKIRVSAPPNENKANKKLVLFLSDYFNVSKSNLELVSGDKSRLKTVLLKNVDEDFVKQKIYIHAKIEA